MPPDSSIKQSAKTHPSSKQISEGKTEFERCQWKHTSRPPHCTHTQSRNSEALKPARTSNKN